MHDIGALFVLDCIASGAICADVTDLGVDVLLSAPLKVGAARLAPAT
jgi:aspartate aminotransferase-like enzyme